MGSFYRDLGRRIAELRRVRGLTQERLAERASITTSYLARIETGARKPTLDVVRRLAGALGVEVWRLLSAEPQREDEPWRGAAEQLVAAVQHLSREDVDLLIEVARRFGRSALEPPAVPTSRAAEPADRKPHP